MPRSDTLPAHPSFWEDGIERPPRPALDGEEAADVAIVGAGITGLGAAHCFQRAGRSVVVLEAKNVGAGTTGHTSAHLTTLWDGGFHELIRGHGEDTARRVARAMREAIDHIEATASELGIDCDFERVPGYHYAEPGQSARSIEREFEAARRLGLEVAPLRDLPLPFSVAQAFRIESQAQFHPLRYLLGLAEAVEADGGRIFEHSRVRDISEGTPCTLETEGGGRIRAGAVLLATHLPLGFSPLQMAAAPYRSYVLAFRPTQDPPEGLFWDAAEPYHYARRYRKGERCWQLVGGADRKVGHGPESASFAELEDHVRKRYRVETIDYRWSSQFYTPADRLPFIGRAPRSRHTYVATGLSGDGLTLGTHAARAIAAELLGDAAGPPPFPPLRFSTTGAGRFVRENADVVCSLVGDRLHLEDEAAIEALAPGDGCVVRTPLSPTAAYRDEEGTVHRFSAVCPHLGCVVRWNSAQRSFDCPCHGSRFDGEGRVLVGPALADLAPKRD